ncbi:MAG: hydroxymethylglutaryl-CoA reductase [Thermoanaerobaculia bacterium]|nr:hydroxymethylglutaryl-CoA reductase [Thermoanaerobaculia bacterium]
MHDRLPKDRPPLVPRYRNQGYDRESVDLRRAWVAERSGANFDHVGRCSLDTETFRGNAENVIGTVQTPVGVAGPLQVCGEHANGVFYVPLATTEGALVRSYERGMVALTRAGGAEVRIWLDRNRITPVFTLPNVIAARDFARHAESEMPRWRDVAASTTQHGRLEGLTCVPAGREVYVDLEFHTADAHGMNMLSKAGDAICRALAAAVPDVVRWQILSGYSAEKRAAGSLLRGGKGKKVTAGCRIPERTVRAVLHSTPEDMAAMWHRTVVGHLASGAIGHNGHVANGLTALFLATGQDVANVANSSVAITQLEVVFDEDEGRQALWASVTLPSLSVATVGGGTGLGTSRECLGLLGCADGDPPGQGQAPKLAEIVAATVLAGELSMAAAIASGEFVEAHESYGRNRPGESDAVRTESDDAR